MFGSIAIRPVQQAYCVHPVRSLLMHTVWSPEFWKEGKAIIMSQTNECTVCGKVWPR
jgi:hypothetical protein